MSLAWKKHRMRCVNRACPKRSWVLSDHRIAAKSCLLTTRAAKWATVQVGGGRTVREVAAELGCDWHTVNDAVCIYGEALLSVRRKRLNRTSAIGLDETSFVKLSSRVTTDYATTVADVENHQIIEILPTRKYTDVAGWINKQSKGLEGADSIRGSRHVGHLHGGLFGDACPRLTRSSIPSTSYRWPIAASTPCADGCRREQTGHRGRRDDPLYRVRRVLLRGEEKLDQGASQRLWSLLTLGDPGAEVAIAYRVKERLRDFYRTKDPKAARAMLRELEQHCRRPTMPPEIQKLGRTLRDWFDKIANFHLARVSNGPTEALNNLIKRIKRIAFGFRNFENYRIRALLYAGKPNWRVLGSIVVR